MSAEVFLALFITDVIATVLLLVLVFRRTFRARKAKGIHAYFVSGWGLNEYAWSARTIVILSQNIEAAELRAMAVFREDAPDKSRWILSVVPLTATIMTQVAPSTEGVSFVDEVNGLAVLPPWEDDNKEPA